MEPSSKYSSDPTPNQKLNRIILVLLLMICSPFLFFNGCLILGWQTQLLNDRLSGPMRLESSIFVTAPNGKTRFEVDTDGTARLVMVGTGRILQTRQIPPEDYKRVQAAWQGNQQVKVICDIRYPAMAMQRDYLWDCKSGAVTVPWSTEVHDFKD